MLGQRGDTIIEVLLAFTVFSMVSVGAMTVMGQGSNASQRALEITLVRQQVDAQAEALRAAQQAYVKQFTGGDADVEWKKVAIANTSENTQHYTDDKACPTPTWVNSTSNGAFIMRPQDASVVTGTTWYGDPTSATAPPYAQVQSNGPSLLQSYGIWIERKYTKSTDPSVPDSFDFNVRACWVAAGVDVPMQIETSVRLYEPGS